MSEESEITLVVIRTSDAKKMEVSMFLAIDVSYFDASINPLTYEISAFTLS